MGTGVGRRYSLYTFLYLLTFELCECIIWFRYKHQRLFLRFSDMSIRGKGVDDQKYLGDKSARLDYLHMGEVEMTSDVAKLLAWAIQLMLLVSSHHCALISLFN